MAFEKLFKSSPLSNPPPHPGGKASALAPIPGSLLFENSTVEQAFRRGLRTSAAVHAGITIGVIIAMFVIPTKTVQYLPSIKVDLVGLPDVTKKDLQTMPTDDLSKLNEKLSEASKGAKKALQEAKKRPVEPPPAADEMTMKSKEKVGREKTLRSAIDRIKALEGIEDESDKKPKKASAPLLKGNVLSKGNSTTGTAAPGDTNAYLGKVQGKLRDNWHLPPWLAKQRLRAKVLMFLDRGGGVKSTMFVEDSGNKQFNDCVLRAIEAAEPFGLPPDDLVDTGITLGFPL